MTREEQIEKVINDDWNHLEGDCPDVAFRKGVNWADSHPQQNWHKYSEEKPKVDDDYIVYLDAPGFCPIIEIYDYSEEDGGFGYFHMSGEGEKVKWVSIDDYVKAWKELPEPPKFN